MANLSTRKQVGVKAPIARGAKSPVKAKGVTKTYEGGTAVTRTKKSDLFLLATTNFYGENTYYETANERAKRFRTLVRKVTEKDPKWVADFLKWLRNEGNIRTAAIVGAVEYCMTPGSPNRREVISSVLIRGDEPAEAVAYIRLMGYDQKGVHPETGMPLRSISGGVQRGIADATTRIYNEFNSLKYDGGSREWRMGDVIELVRPAATSVAQNDLFKYLLDKGHKRENVEIPESLQMVANRHKLENIDSSKRRKLLTNSEFPQMLRDTGANWEWVSGWLNDGKGMDKDAWEAIIPSMGYMALLRNLRNFDEAGVSDQVAAQVAAKLSNPEAVAKSRQFPFRFLSAYKAAPSLRWSWALEQALDQSCMNLPVFNGRTLILTDTSGSMNQAISDKSKVMLWEVGGLFAAALARKAQGGTGGADLVSFASQSEAFPIAKGESVLPALARWQTVQGRVGYGTETGAAIQRHFRPGFHERVVIFTDGQSFPVNGRNYWGYGGDISSLVPQDVPMYSFNLAGYAQSDLDTGKPNRHEFGGFTDNAFKMIPLLEQGKDQKWPWMN